MALNFSVVPQVSLKVLSVGFQVDLRLCCATEQAVKVLSAVGHA